MELFDAEMLAKELMSKYVPQYHFAFNNLKNTNGLCDYGKRTIYLSRHLTKLRNPEAVCQTIMHEIAHALTPGANHGPAWRAQMRKFGFNPERRSSDKVDRSSISNWRAICKSCGAISYQIRKPRVDRSCGVCSRGKFNTKFLLTFVKI